MSEEHKQPDIPKKKKEGPRGAPMWMVTYSDLVTLLLTFFVLLLSMASLDPVRFTQASSSLRDAFGMHALPDQVEFKVPVLPSPPLTKYSPIASEMTRKVFQRIKNQISAEKLSQDIEVVEKEGDTLILRVKDSVLFEPGETKISPESYPLLRYIADTIRPMPLLLRIEGHTDAVTETQIEMSRWDISMARSVSVMRFYTKGEFLPLERMAAVGYGASNPLASNETPEGRAKNRRVDFVLRANSTMDVNGSESPQNEIPF